MEIGDLKFHRGVVKGSITRAVTHANSMDTSTVTLENIRIRKALLESNYKRYTELQQDIEQLCQEVEQLPIQEADRTETENKFIESMTIYDQFIVTKEAALRPPESHPPVTTFIPTPQVQTVNVRLPAIELPIFEGNYADWTSFSDLFLSTIHSRVGLSNSQKLQYLKTSVKGDAANLIKSLPITNENYNDAWNILKERYENERAIVNSIIRRLITQPSIQRESATQLQTLLDTTKECLRALTVLKRPVQHWDDLIIYIFVEKLDSESRKQWALRQNGTSLPTFKQLSDFVEQHARGLLASSNTMKPDKKPTSSHFGSTDMKCKVCKSSHPIYQCTQFVNSNYDDKIELVKKHRLCYNCLRPNHQTKQCKSTHTCKTCKGRHNSLLHKDSSTAAPAPPSTLERNVNSTDVHTCTSQFTTDNQENTQVLLSTVVAKVKDTCGNDQYVRILLDSGSQATMITEKCANALGLRRQPSNVLVSGISSTAAGQAKGEVSIKLYSTTCHASLHINALVFTKVTGNLPKYTCEKQQWSHLEGLTLADPQYAEPGSIDILLGADYTAAIMREGIRSGPKHSPIAQNTVFGWILCGRIHIDCGHLIQSNHTHCELENIVKKFWELEQIPEIKHLTDEEKFCEENFLDTYQRDDSGRFVVHLPLNNKVKELGFSLDLATQRLKQVERRLAKRPEFKSEYIKFMQQYEALGHMQEIPPDQHREVIGQTNYLPHHFVLKIDSTTTNFRVVFDGSASTSTGVSLNNALHVGAIVQNDSFTIMLKFRLHIVVVKADCEKMFRQFNVFPEHCDLQRIIWRESPELPIRHYKLLTVTYGQACATYLSTRCLKMLAENCTEKYPTGSLALLEDTYVDDLVSGSNCVEKRRQLVSDIIDISNSAGLTFRKWVSNDEAVLSQIPIDMREKETDFDLDKSESVKALGIRWNAKTDTFSFQVKIEKIDIFTKRMMLSELAKVYDPLGLITPITIIARMLFQEIWLVKGVTWESKIPATINQKWIDYRNELKSVEEITIPRCILPENTTEISLHGFCDASERAYGAVIYMRYLSAEDKYKSRMITSKARVAPMQRLSIERLELCGAAVLATLMTATKRALKINCETYAWCDSTIVLRYIAAHPSRWKTFVAHKVAKIQANIPVESWRHVKGTENPADLISRGVCPSKLKQSSLWWEGPAWLSSGNLPTLSPLPAVNTNLEERKKVLLAFTTNVENNIEYLHKHSSLTKLLRVTAYMFRFVRKSQKKSSFIGPITSDELEAAKLFWIRQVQQHYFKREYDVLKTGGQVQNKSSLKTLHPYVDSEGYIRVGGRLINSNLPDQHKHQLIIPQQSHLAKLLIRNVHWTHLHAGLQLTMAHLQQQYWIPKARCTIRSLIRKCVVCRRQRAETCQQLMGSLPKSRVRPSHPFQNTGVDYAGPFNLRVSKGRSNKTFKAYFAIFVCMCTKAVHLEAVSDLTSDGFIAALRRFISRRGLCENIFSDCGTNFVGGEKELQTQFQQALQHESVPSEMASQGIRFQYNSPGSPNQGGLWEAGVKSVKYHLRRVVGTAVLTFEEFQTVLCQVEACLNSRPLCALSTDPNDFLSLTPGHFLIGRPLTAIPEPSYEELKINRLSRWQLCQQLTQHFWRRWSTEYLTTLQQRFKWTQKRENLQENDLVLIKDELLPPTRWKLGRVVELLYGSDNCVRNVIVKTMSGFLKRAVCKLTPILYNDEKD